MKRTAVLVAGLCVATLAAIGVYRAGLNETPPPPSSPQIVFKRGMAQGQRIHTRSWSAEYDRAISNPDQTIFDLTGVKNGVIYRRGRPYLHVRAQHMNVNMISRDFSATGPLHVETVDGKPDRTFDTTSAVWNDAEQTLALSQHIVIHTTGEAPLNVGSLTFNVKTGKLEMHQVAGPLKLK